MENLRPRRLGAEVLARIARERRDGELTWIDGGKQRKIVFGVGRPEEVIDRDGRQSKERQHVVAVVRALALSASGQCIFERVNRNIPAVLGIDTLGETLVALATGLGADELASIWAARRDETVELTGVFGKFATAVVQVGGARVQPPEGDTTVGNLMAGLAIEAQRAWAALISLGAVKSQPACEGVLPNPQPGTVPVAAQRAATTSPEAAPQPSPKPLVLPDDPEARRVAMEIERAFRTREELDCYQILGVDRSVSEEQVREAYFEVARKWHSDRVNGYRLSEDFKRKAEELFRRAGEARDILCDAEKRKTYDFVERRKAEGLPTDVMVILEAESVFRKGQTLVRRGQAAGAEPILRQAVELNKGEAEFWAYLGFAVYAAKGSEGVGEAKRALRKALEMNPKLDAAHEFLGRIARVEGNLGEAHTELKTALEMNPRNVDAQRELRLINMRSSSPKERQSKGLGGVLGGLLKR